MKRILASILCVLGLSPQATEAALSPESFTDEFIATLRGALPNHSVTVVTALHVHLKDRSGKESTAFLDNAYNEYIRDPPAKADVLARYVASLVEMADDSERLDPSRIVPVIKDRAWLEDIQRASERSGLEPMAGRVVDDFNGDLVIVYGEDSPNSIRYFSPPDLQEAGIEREKLRDLAVANLRRILPEIETHSGPLVSMLTAGGDYVSSLLLIDELWSGGKLDVDGDIVIAVPSRDVLLFTGSRNVQGVRKLQDMARSAQAESSYSLTDLLFVYRGGTFQRFTQ